MPHVTNVPCSACGHMTPRKTARQLVLSWCLSHSGEGTMTQPQEVQQTGTHECPSCFAKRRYGMESGAEQEGLAI